MAIQVAMDYESFLESKRLAFDHAGFECDMDTFPQALFDWQRKVVRWAVFKGRAAVFADCGCGKTPMQLAWADQVARHTGKPVIILAPLAVSHQTIREGEKFGIEACRADGDHTSMIHIINYDRMHYIDPELYGGIVADESSLLKNLMGKMRRQITEFASFIPYRLACTATPAPNDLPELLMHSEFLGVMLYKEVIANFFKQDGNSSNKFRLRRHAVDDFWKWVATWAVAFRKPSDLGYDDGPLILPEIEYHMHEIKTDPRSRDTLLPVAAHTQQERLGAKRASIFGRVEACVDVVKSLDEPWAVWCHLDDEQRALERALGDKAISIYGSLKPEQKEERLIAWLRGEKPILISKPSITGYGINMQHCHNTAFVGLNDSYEMLYQAIRRFYRFFQQHKVNVHIFSADTEVAVLENIRRKETESTQMIDEIIGKMRGLSLEFHAVREEMKMESKIFEGPGWMIRQGDCVDLIDTMDDDAVGLAVFSPPFPAMYAYTNSPHDMGNTTNMQQMLDQFRYLVSEDKLLRAMMPGRSCCIHLTQTPIFKYLDGHVGIRDFRGKVISIMEDEGWIYYGEVLIDKDPQLRAIRTKDRGLLFKTLASNAEHMHMALADYLLQFRKPGESPAPIKAGISKRYKNEDGWITPEEWIEWAAPVWYKKTAHYPGGISETDVLNTLEAKEVNDERHVCPLQLGVIERAIKLWSNPGDLVLDPFNGIGSTGYKALQLKRRYVGYELKPSYVETSLKNMDRALANVKQMSLL